MLRFIFIHLILVLSSAYALPIRHTKLLPFVQEAPNQGDSGSCLYVAATGAMEILANKNAGIENPLPYGEFDLSESFAMWAPNPRSNRSLYFWEQTVLRYNVGYGIHVDDWPYEAWSGTYSPTNGSVWKYRNWKRLPHLNLPKIETVPLFAKGRNRWSTRVLKRSDIQKIKEALSKYNAPIMVNYNDYGYWHTILIVGYDDSLPGSCYNIKKSECGEQIGSFYVRDSFGTKVEVRDYDWFYIKGNAAFVVKEKN